MSTPTGFLCRDNGCVTVYLISPIQFLIGVFDVAFCTYIHINMSLHFQLCSTALQLASSHTIANYSHISNELFFYFTRRLMLVETLKLQVADLNMFLEEERIQHKETKRKVSYYNSMG